MEGYVKHYKKATRAASRAISDPPGALLGLDMLGTDPPLNMFQDHHHDTTSIPLEISGTSFGFDFLNPRRPDAWNPLQVTTRLPNSSTDGNCENTPDLGQQASEASWRFPVHRYYSLSERSGPVIHTGYSDSGYGGRNSGDAQSVISSSYPIESVPSPSIASSRHDNRFDIRVPKTYRNEVYKLPAQEILSFNEEKWQTLHLTSLKCSECAWIGKTSSEKKSVW
jgi:hypothetical protein